MTRLLNAVGGRTPTRARRERARFDVYARARSVFTRVFIKIRKRVELSNSDTLCFVDAGNDATRTAEHRTRVRAVSAFCRNTAI